MIILNSALKSFTLHLQGGLHLPVIEDARLSVAPGECVALTGPSGTGKSTVMRMIYGNYLTEGGSIMVGDLDVATASPREIIRLRREVLGYVSQFLRVVPRVSAVDVVAEPLLALGTPSAEARDRAEALLDRLNLPRALWSLPPMTFSGG
ncbi:MAG: ATP-binding cassette domain-containing protein, partial [Pseudomonadota bacterium]